MSLPSVAVVIPTRGRPLQLARCLRQVVPYVSLHHECRIFVTDDGNAEETRAVIEQEFPGVVVVQGPRRGPAANRNWGAGQSKVDLLIFMDDDCIPESSVIAEFQSAAVKHPHCGVFEGRISPIGKSDSFGEYCPANEDGGHLWSCNLAIRQDLFASIGGFDERYPFPAMEDADLRVRVEANSPILFIPEARVFHGYEKRPGMKIMRHNALSLLLFAHLHGLQSTGRSPSYFLRASARLLVFDGARILRRRATGDLKQMIFMLWVYAKLLIITMLWRFRGVLAKRLFPACCQSCQSLHANLGRD
jgi:GT2 family glycosyltransferase